MLPIGKNNSGSSSRQAASSCQLTLAPCLLPHRREGSPHPSLMIVSGNNQLSEAGQFDACRIAECRAR